MNYSLGLKKEKQKEDRDSKRVFTCVYLSVKMGAAGPSSPFVQERTPRPFLESNIRRLFTKVVFLSSFRPPPPPPDVIRRPPFIRSPPFVPALPLHSIRPN